MLFKAYMLVEVSTVRSCKMAIQAVSVVLTLWGMHSNAPFYCDPICLGNVTSGIFWSLLEDGREERLVSVDCSLSANWVLCLPCALFFNIVLAHRKEKSSRTVCSEQAEGGAGATRKDSFP